MTTYQKKSIAKKLTSLILAGKKLSNICYNMSQDSCVLDKHVRMTMKSTQEEWDAAILSLPRWMFK